jgi:hypothetical protein
MRKDARINLPPTAILLAACTLASCGSNTTRHTGARITAEQFAAASAPAVPVPAPVRPAPSASPAPDPIDPVEAPPRPLFPPPDPADTLALRSFVGEPDLLGAPARPIDTPIALESVVGQINGRPLFVSEILTPLDGRLRALAVEVKGDRAAFIRGCSSDIIGIITNEVRDELILAEAQASLPLEVRQGLFYFLGKIQQNLVSTQAGSELQADEAIRESTGRTLQQEARDRLERELITSELRAKVIPRVNVPWRLIRQEYERNYDKYNPPGTAILRVIAVPAADADAVRQAEQAIAAGTFADAAAMEFNTFLRSTGGLVSRELEGPYQDAPFFADPAMNAAAQTLSPGQTSPPTRWDDKIVWIHLQAIDQEPGISLYDAQLEIETSLRDRKFVQERNIYFERLLERGSFTRIESMVQETMAIAVERYLPAQPK